MQEFATLAQALVDMVNTPSAWITMGIMYGGFLLVGVVVGKVACAIDGRLGAVAAIIAAVSIVDVYRQGGGSMLFPIVWPPAWVAWGVIGVWGRRIYLWLHNETK